MDAFAHAPVALWIADFSAVKRLVSIEDGFEVARARLLEDERLARRCCEAVQVVDANLAAAALMGVERDEMQGPITRWISDPGVAVVAIATLTGRSPFRHDLNLVIDGEQLTFELHVSADANDPARAIVASINQTQRLRSAADLRESEERFRTILEHAPVMVDQFDGEGNCILWNRECELRLGYSQAEVQAHGDPLSLFYPDEQERQRVLQAIMRADGQFREYRVLAKSGELRNQLWADFRLPSGAQISVGHDITDLREAEARERRLEEQMWQTQKLESLGVLAGGIAHDFNNLLVGVLANADLAKTSQDPDLRARLLDDIIEAARRAADLSTQMLSYSGHPTLVRKPVDLTVLLRDLAPMVAAAASKKAQLRYELGPGLVVEGDATQLRQVVFNLILNAAEALDEQLGTVQVHARRERREGLRVTLADETLPAGEYVCVEVTDDGCGMSEDTLVKMFDPFFTTKFTGRGLGLASVLGIVRGHGGTLEVESTEGVGTTCRVFLPASQTDVERAPKKTNRGAIRPMTIMVVDDEPMVRRTTAILLESEAHSVLEAPDGDVALRLFRDERDRIDLAIIDATMPRMSGVELITALRRIAPEVGLVLVSGYSEDRAAMQLAGKVSFLQKPYSVGELNAAMRRALDTKS